tara:strand:+ start:294 stop:524 length:231 start_codon:yes stop_codon:yes gene_type:complete
MNVADVDGNGSVDFEEFKDFINKLEDGQDDVSTDEGLKGIFDSIDENGNGELSVEEFGQAIFKVIGPAEEEDEDVE